MYFGYTVCIVNKFSKYWLKITECVIVWSQIVLSKFLSVLLNIPNCLTVEVSVASSIAVTKNCFVVLLGLIDTIFFTECFEITKSMCKSVHTYIICHIREETINFAIALKLLCVSCIEVPN